MAAILQNGGHLYKMAAIFIISATKRDVTTILIYSCIF